ncbi:MAG: hypothetical protein J6S14_12850 [Clostridia bacterium]|nr:hypothetical protein [Clostridia bacterium]
MEQKDCEKQVIEEMAKDVARSISWCNEEIPTVDCLGTAASLYDKCYRKQSEGEWEKRTFIIFDSEKVGYNCSECNTTWDTETNFCPYCGAKMKGMKDEKTD